VTAILQANLFVDLTARRVAADLFGCMERGEVFTLQLLLGRHDESEIKNLLTSLYRDGQRMCSERESQLPQLFAGAVHTLLDHIQREQYRQSVTQFRMSKTTSDDAIQAVRELLEQRRKQPLMADAISSSTRR
jgi:predicted transcriptional regulator